MFKCQHFSTNLFDESSVCGLLIPEEDERGVDDPPEVDDDDENDNWKEQINDNTLKLELHMQLWSQCHIKISE